MTPEPAQLAEQGKRAFEQKNFEEAAGIFRRAAEGFASGRDGLMAAEMKNNLSVALLQAGNPQEALNAALGTDELFAEAHDLKRQAMSLGNQAAALEALDRMEEALAKYDLSAELFDKAGQGDLRALVMRSAAAVEFKAGRIKDSAFTMLGALGAKEKPSFFERILKFFLRFIK